MTEPLTASPELAAIVSRQRAARPWVDEATQGYVLRFSLPRFDLYRRKHRRRRPCKRLRNVLKNKSA